MLAAQSVQPSNSSNAIAANAAQSSGGGNTYSVVRGDCLWKIAQAHGVSLSAVHRI